MPPLTSNHKTEYRDAHPAALGEHRAMVRPCAAAPAGV
jgi:hypothetical protein